MLALKTQSNSFVWQDAAPLVAEPPAGLRPSRKDALPEHTHYADTGCDLHASCLSCPLAHCRYDQPGGARRLLSGERDRRIVRLQQDEQLPVELIAQRFGVSRRTVFRVLARERLGGRGGGEDCERVENPS
jgi:hypothetical protein